MLLIFFQFNLLPNFNPKVFHCFSWIKFSGFNLTTCFFLFISIVADVSTSLSSKSFVNIIFDRAENNKLKRQQITIQTFTEAVMQRCSVKNVFLEILKNWQDNTCARVIWVSQALFLIKNNSKCFSPLWKHVLVLIIISSL